MCVLPYTGKSYPDLRADLRCMIAKNIPFFVSLLLCLDSLADFITCLDSKITLRKKSCLEQSTTLCAVTVRLLIKEKLSDIFLLEHLNTWELQI